jgi:hypothetical protein
MTTVRDRYGLACPNCHRDNHIRIWTYTTVALTPKGSVETNDAFHEWNPDHHCSCKACGHEGVVSDFMIEEVSL